MGKTFEQMERMGRRLNSRYEVVDGPEALKVAGGMHSLAFKMEMENRTAVVFAHKLEEMAQLAAEKRTMAPRLSRHVAVFFLHGATEENRAERIRATLRGLSQAGGED